MATMPPDEALCGINDIVPVLSSDNLSLDSVQGPSCDVTGVPPLLQVLFLNHDLTSNSLTNPSLRTSISLDSVES